VPESKILKEDDKTNKSFWDKWRKGKDNFARTSQIRGVAPEGEMEAWKKSIAQTKPSLVVSRRYRGIGPRRGMAQEEKIVPLFTVSRKEEVGKKKYLRERSGHHLRRRRGSKNSIEYKLSERTLFRRTALTLKDEGMCLNAGKKEHNDCGEANTVSGTTHGTADAVQTGDTEGKRSSNRATHFLLKRLGERAGREEGDMEGSRQGKTACP